MTIAAYYQDKANKLLEKAQRRQALQADSEEDIKNNEIALETYKRELTILNEEFKKALFRSVEAFGNPKTEKAYEFALKHTKIKSDKTGSTIRFRYVEIEGIFKDLLELLKPEEETQPCVSCGANVPAKLWYIFAPVILCEKCGGGENMGIYKDELKKEGSIKKASLNRGKP